MRPDYKKHILPITSPTKRGSITANCPVTLSRTAIQALYPKRYLWKCTIGCSTRIGTVLPSPCSPTRYSVPTAATAMGGSSGRLITSWQCDSRVADREFLFSKLQYMKDAQENSLQSQQEYFTEYIQCRPGWVFAGMYAER